MIFFKSKRIRELEAQIGYYKSCYDRLRDDVYLLQGDQRRILYFLGADIQSVNKREVVKKGGPEKGE